MKIAEVAPKNPLQAQAQALRKRAQVLSAAGKRQTATASAQKAQQQLASANKAEAALRQKLQATTSKPGTSECRVQQRAARKSVPQNITDLQSRASSFGSAQEEKGKTQ